MSKDLTGTTLGKYQVMERLGRGGMADVYRAYQPGMDRYVAIKVMHGHLAEDPSFITRFKREAQSVGALRHPNIVQVIDFDTQDDEYYMVMEYIQGKTLKAVLQERGALPVGEALNIAAKLADALAYAHGEGMVHRDIKPANILFSKANVPILTDFGIARIMDSSGLTASGAFVGTPAYMSPEGGRGEKVDERGDIYSLGIVLYEMLTGTVPYDADTPYAVILKHINDPLPLPRQFVAALPDSVERVVLKALMKQKEDRFATAAEFRDALLKARDESLAELPTQVSPGKAAKPPVSSSSLVETVLGEPTLPPDRGGANKGLVAVAAAVIVIVLVAGGAIILSGNRSVTPTTLPSTSVVAVQTPVLPTPTLAPTMTVAVSAIPPASKYVQLIDDVKHDIINGNTSDALAKLADPLKADPQSYDLLVLQMRVQGESNDADPAKIYADTMALIKSAPDRPEAYILLSGYYWFVNADKPEDIIANMKNVVANATLALEKGSTDYYAYWLRARAKIRVDSYIGTTDGYPSSSIEQDYESAAALSPQDQRFYMNRGEYYFYEKNYPKSQESYEKAASLFPDADARSGNSDPWLAGLYMLQGQNDKAYTLYADSIEKNNVHWPKHFANGAYVAWVDGKKDKAAEWAQLAIGLDVNTPAATYVQALLAWDAGKYDDALKAMDEVAKVTETWMYTTPFLNHLYNRDLNADRGRILTAAGKIDDAIAAYSASIDQDNSWSPALVEVAKLYIRQGAADNARQALGRALEIALNNQDEKTRTEVLQLLSTLGDTPTPTSES